VKPCDELVIGIDPDRNIDATPLESKALVRDNLGQHNSAPAIPQDVSLQMDIQDCCKNCFGFLYFAPFFYVFLWPKDHFDANYLLISGKRGSKGY
jgi:hypothetical protein